VLFSITGFAQTDSSFQHTTDPKANEEARKEIEHIRNNIISGKTDFATAAITYSMDPGSAMKGGFLGTVHRGEMVPEFEAVSFNIQENVVSEVFETAFGYHILMVDAIRGNEIDVRHILIVPQIEK
jgi:peptidyl-prolyl cis-trans isomerase SurA